MYIATQEYIYILLAFFAIATLYSSVGFGGGSSYLALLTLVFTSFFVIRSTALLCNLMVVSGSSYLYLKHGHLQVKKYAPFIITSIPFAFIGAVFRLEEQVFFIVLGIALLGSAIALLFQTYTNRNRGEKQKKYPLYITYLLGVVIGFVSGLVGIGGGIFLAPILNHMKWDKPIKIAALASFFILVNSVSGIAGLLVKGTFIFSGIKVVGLLLAVIIGGQLGIRISLNRFTGISIKVVTALLIIIVGVRILLKNGFLI